MVAAGRVLGRERDALGDATGGRKGWDFDWQRGMRVLTSPSSFYASLSRQSKSRYSISKSTLGL